MKNSREVKKEVGDRVEGEKENEDRGNRGSTRCVRKKGTVLKI